ncbi:MAG TPA: DUF1854 domain-containing protein [Planctomycetota bacterium]|nr:DUF1854 domain-containing protein [Planctomycetota bacterium]HRR78913.1 DUF1854 domain-containing protein [Planctomycetota bacterium]HRT92809.1 DUF1854 domain-containing protein [Planctomycetota bacterium]
MPFHIHDHGGSGKAADSGPSLPMPDETSSELRFLDPAAVQFRQNGARLQFRCAPADRVGGAAPSHDTVGGTSPSREPRREDTPPTGDTPPTPDDAEWRDVTLVRLFPLTEPEHWVSLVEMNGKEVGVLRDLSRLGHEALRLARDELRRRYLVPRIVRILACRPRADLVEWTVETDRGRQKFLTREVREQIKEHQPTRLSIVDVEGNRYDIPDLAALDPESRRRLDAQL